MEYLNNGLEQLSSQFGSTLPRLIGALLLLFVGLFVARIIRGVARKGLAKAGVDKFSSGGTSSLSTIGSKLIYFVVVLLVLMFVLDMMGLTAALDPIKDMLSKFLGYIPNIIAAGIIGFVGFMVANIGKEATGMATGGLNDLMAKHGFSEMNVSGILKQLVFIVILIPILLVALDTLNISMISDPAKHMLESLFDAIPNIIAAGIILTVFLFGGRFVSKMIGDLLNNMNLDKTAQSLGISSMVGEGNSISGIISKVVYFYIAFFGVTTAIEKLEFSSLTEILYTVMGLTGKILLGMVILVIGNKISQMVGEYFAKSDSPAMSSIGRFATLGLFLAISLRQMGLADDIVNLAFGLTLGAVAVAFALSFGLGGREAAGKQMEGFFNKFNGK